jgi:hypothetical protein
VNKKKMILILTVLNHLVFLGVIGWLVREEAFTEAYQEELQLGPIYYGENAITSVFDHDLPIPGDEDTDGNTYVMHYDGSTNTTTRLHFSNKARCRLRWD